jgi:hypothetical protein
VFPPLSSSRKYVEVALDDCVLCSPPHIKTPQCRITSPLLLQLRASALDSKSSYTTSSCSFLLRKRKTDHTYLPSVLFATYKSTSIPHYFSPPPPKSYIYTPSEKYIEQHAMSLLVLKMEKRTLHVGVLLLSANMTRFENTPFIVSCTSTARLQSSLKTLGRGSNVFRCSQTTLYLQANVSAYACGPLLAGCT